MEDVDVYEAKTRLGKLIERVKRCEQFTITKEGEPVAILKHVEAYRKSHPKDVIREIKEFRKAHSTGDISIKEMIEKGRT